MPFTVRVVFCMLLVMVVVLRGWHAYCTLQRPMGITNSIGVLGRVTSIPRCNQHSCRFEFTIEKNTVNDMAGRLLMYWYGRHKEVEAGQVWYFSIHCRYCNSKVKRPLWLLAKGDVSTATVQSKKIHFLSERSFPGVWLQLRTTIQRGIEQAVKQPALAAFLTALAIGSRALLLKANWNVFQNTGTSHLVAISGLHVGFIFWFWRVCFRWLWSRQVTWVQRVPACLAADGGALLLAMMYSGLAGLSLPTQRALIMLLVMVVPSVCGRQVPVWRRLLLAFGVMVMLNPLSVLQMGFWLSFCAVACILYCAVDSRAQKPWQVWLKMQLGLTFLLLPITLYDFSKVSLVSMVANAVAVPWVTFVVVPGVFIATLVFLFSHPLGGFLFKGMSWLLAPLWWYLCLLAHAPYAIVKVNSASSVTVLLCSTLGMILLFIPKGIPGRFVGLLWLCPLLTLPWHQ